MIAVPIAPIVLRSLLIPIGWAIPIEISVTIISLALLKAVKNVLLIGVSQTSSDLFRPTADLVEGPVCLGAAVVHADGAVLEGAVLRPGAVDPLGGVGGEYDVLGVPVAHVLEN